MVSITGPLLLFNIFIFPANLGSHPSLQNYLFAFSVALMYRVRHPKLWQWLCFSIGLYDDFPSFPAILLKPVFVPTWIKRGRSLWLKLQLPVWLWTRSQGKLFHAKPVPKITDNLGHCIIANQIVIDGKLVAVILLGATDIMLIPLLHFEFDCCVGKVEERVVRFNILVPFC